MKILLAIITLSASIYAIERGTVSALIQLHQARESEAFAWEQVERVEAENARQNAIIAELDQRRWGYFVSVERKLLARAEGRECRHSRVF